MDSNHQNQQFHQLGQPQLPSQPPPPQQQQPQQQPQSQLHLSQSQLQLQQLQQLHQQQQQQQQQPQDVLAEARKNLQVLIDSGLSKDLLHQWVDDSLSLQLSFPGQPSLAHTLASSASPTASAASTPIPSPLLAHPASHAQSHLQSPTQPPPPPPPQCAPPPIPTISHSSPIPSVSTASPAATSPTPAQNSAALPTSTADSSPAAAATPTVAIIKPEPSFAEDVSRTWAAIPQTPTSMPGPPAPIQSLPVTPTHDQAMAAPDPAIFIPPTMPFLNHHRPRISVSSTSSGSSGHASIWSVNSAHSSMSWHSTSSSRSQAPLPMPPMTSAGGAPLIGNSQAAAAANRQNIYWCTSCETSFKRKYDWKRHEDEFHERWRKYPCPEPGCNRSFWGSNSFNQHHKQCHGCKTCPHAEKVVKFLRKRKYWACGFCSALHPARERHVEHVARHFESGLTKNDWMHSRVIYGLLRQPLIHEAWDALVASKQPEYAGRRPQFSWHPSKTGRAQGFLEKENPGQLQDLLEFFSGDQHEAQWIVGIAYNLSDIVFANPPPVPSQQYAHNAMGPPPPYQQHPDPRMSFAPLPSQAPPQQPHMLASPVSGTPSPFNSSPFRNPSVFVPSQAFSAVQQPSPDSSTQSPMTATHSPHVLSQSYLDKRELPPVPQQPHGPAAGDGMMDFEYSPAPVGFEDWESIASSTLLDTSHSQQQQQPNQGTQADWGMSQYYTDPRVAS